MLFRSGSIENRAMFPLEIMEVATNVVGEDRLTESDSVSPLGTPNME